MEPISSPTEMQDVAIQMNRHGIGNARDHTPVAPTMP
jgi:hypothetical protein